MKLFSSPNSPYARKCRVVALEKDVALVEVAVDVSTNPPELLKVNPLGKIPALVTDDGLNICDSPVICEYLDSLSATSPLIPQAGIERIGVLNMAAIADGIMDAAVACVLEGRRPTEKQWDGWIQRQHGKITLAIELLAGSPYLLHSGVNLGTLACAVALDYVSFRIPQIEWRAKHPALARWLDEMKKRESLQKTAPVAA